MNKLKINEFKERWPSPSIGKLHKFHEKTKETLVTERSRFAWANQKMYDFVNDFADIAIVLSDVKDLVKFLKVRTILQYSFNSAISET